MDLLPFAYLCGHTQAYIDSVLTVIAVQSCRKGVAERVYCL